MEGSIVVSCRQNKSIILSKAFFLIRDAPKLGSNQNVVKGNLLRLTLEARVADVLKVFCYNLLPNFSKYLKGCRNGDSSNCWLI